MILVRHNLSDLNDLANLARSAYDYGEIISEKYLDWEYKLNPSGKAIINVSNDNGRVISQYVVLPKNYSHNGEIVTGSLSLNTITHKDHRGHNYFPRLAELTFSDCVKENIYFTIGFPNKNSIKGFRNKLKFSEIGRLPLLLKINNPVRAFFDFIFRSKENNAEISIDFKGNISGISKLDLIEDEVNYISFWKEFLKKDFTTTVRTPEYLEWRYIKIPFRKYHLFKFENDGKIKGILVLRAKNIMGVKCGIIVDYLTVDENLIIKPFLIEFSKSKLDILFATFPENSTEFVSLKKTGFIKVPNFLMLKKLHVIIRLHSTNISNTITDFRKWFITFGDYDIF